MTANGEPENNSQIMNEEHDHTSTAKRMIGVDSSGNLVDGNDIRFDADDSAPDYIGTHTTNGAATLDANWLIYKFTYSGSNVTRIQKAKGAWDDRATLF